MPQTSLSVSAQIVGCIAAALSKLSLFSLHVSAALKLVRTDMLPRNLSADRYGAKELGMNTVANARAWNRRLDPLYAQSLDILCKRDGTSNHIRGGCLGL